MPAKFTGQGEFSIFRNPSFFFYNAIMKFIIQLLVFFKLVKYIMAKTTVSAPVFNNSKLAFVQYIPHLLQLFCYHFTKNRSKPGACKIIPIFANLIIGRGIIAQAGIV